MHSNGRCFHNILIHVMYTVVADKDFAGKRKITVYGPRMTKGAPFNIEKTVSVMMYDILS